MISYLLKSGCCLALLLAFYHLILEREKMHQFNRFYLLGSVLVSFVAPLFIIYTEIPVEFIEVPTENVAQQLILEGAESTETTVNYWFIAIAASLFISLVLTLRFSKNLFSIFKKTQLSTKKKHGRATLVLVEDTISPHTFWNYIFINKQEYEQHKIEDQLYTHELTHVTQKHTIDVLFIEVLKIVFWFNPLFYLLKKSIQLNHEFIADSEVINSYKNISEYQYLLLNKTAWNSDYYLASNLNYSLTKKRLVMMTTKTSKVNSWLKKLAVIPLLTGTVFLFAERVEAQEKASATIVKEYNVLAKKYNNASKSKQIKLADVERLHYLYAKLNNKQKEASETFPKFPPAPPIPKKVKKGEKSIIPPPPKPQTGFVNVKGQKLYYVKNNKGISYYNRWGQQVTKEGKVINSKQTRSNEVIPGQNIHKVYKDDKVIAEFNNQNSSFLNLPQDKNIRFFLDGEEISKEKLKKISSSSIEKVDVIKEKDGLSSVYVFSKRKASEQAKEIKTFSKNKNIKYFLDGEQITKEKLDLINTSLIKKVDVKKNKDGSGTVYITSKKK